MSKDKIHQKAKPKWFTSYWIMIVVATIIVGVMLPIFEHIPLERAVLFLILVLAAEGLAYYGRVKRSLNLNRIMYILIGVPIGFVLWFIVMLFSINIFGQGIDEDFVFVTATLAACFGVGAFIGDLIGRARCYKGPEQYQP